MEKNKYDLIKQQVLILTFPGEGKVRSRKIVTRSRARATGKFPSKKMKRMIQWESTNELNAFRLLEVEPTIKSYSEQPMRIDYFLDGECRKHYPDVLVVKSDGKELWEIKSVEELEKEKYKKRTRFLKKHLPMHGYSYRTISNEDLACQPWLSNSLLLLRNNTKQATDVERELIRQTLMHKGCIKWGLAEDQFLGCYKRQILSGLVIKGFLYADLSLPITDETEFRLLDDSAEVINELFIA